MLKNINRGNYANFIYVYSEAAIVFFLSYVFSYFLMHEEINFMESRGLVFYYVLSPGEEGGPIGDPLKVVSVMIVAIFNFTTFFLPQILQKKISYLSMSLLAFFNSALIVASGIRLS